MKIVYYLTIKKKTVEIKFICIIYSQIFNRPEFSAPINITTNHAIFILQNYFVYYLCNTLPDLKEHNKKFIHKLSTKKVFYLFFKI